ncbi:MAG: hypothetical protein LBH87_01170 [Coriobacteriales bacterium]|nr:hypothetical protein [Coriobacteriales bacterium]
MSTRERMAVQSNIEWNAEKMGVARGTHLLCPVGEGQGFNPLGVPLKENGHLVGTHLNSVGGA